MVDGPKPTGKANEVVSLNGKVFPWLDGAPVVLRMSGSSFLYLPCFSSAKLLRKVMFEGEFKWDSIKVIDDESAFLVSAHQKPDVRVILDLHRTSEGVMRFTEIQRWLQN